MKKVILALLGCALLMPVFAQDDASANDAGEVKKEKKEKKPSKVGNFLRRVGESATGINMSNETFVALDFSAQRLMQVQVKSCYGDSKTGQVVLELTVAAKSAKTRISIGGKDVKKHILALDAQGNSFEGQGITISHSDMMPNTPMKYEYVFTGVPAGLMALECVQLSYYVNSPDGIVGSNIGDGTLMQVRNVPVVWDPVQE